MARSVSIKCFCLFWKEILLVAHLNYFGLMLCQFTPAFDASTNLMLNLKQSKELICFFIKYPLVWFCTQDAPSSGACTTPHGSVVLQISSFQAVYQSGTSFSAGGETKISWLFSKTEQGLGCCSPPGMSR